MRSRSAVGAGRRSIKVVALALALGYSACGQSTCNYDPPLPGDHVRCGPPERVSVDISCGPGPYVPFDHARICYGPCYTIGPDCRVYDGPDGNLDCQGDGSDITLAFDSPQHESATIEVMDPSGKVVYSHTASYPFLDECVPDGRLCYRDCATFVFNWCAPDQDAGAKDSAPDVASEDGAAGTGGSTDASVGGTGGTDASLEADGASGSDASLGGAGGTSAIDAGD